MALRLMKNTEVLEVEMENLVANMFLLGNVENKICVPSKTCLVSDRRTNKTYTLFR